MIAVVAPCRAVDALRHRARAELRGRVVGPHADRRRAEIFDAVGPRRFGPDDPIWRVHADASMFVGGLRALLLQSLHPVAMRAVAEHSGYRGDPWGRLQRTADFVAATTYGTEAVADAAIARVRSVHRRVRGNTVDGQAYRADDPHLLEWVHIAEIDSFLVAYERHGAATLSARDADRYVAQTGDVAVSLGVIDPPATRDELRRRLRQFRDELRSTPEAMDAARFLLAQPPLPLAARPVYGALAAAAVTSLPLSARIALGVPTPPLADVLVGRPLGQLVTYALRWIAV